MERTKRVAWVIVVLGLGFWAAMMFPKRERELAENVEPDQAGVSFRGNAPATVDSPHTSSPAGKPSAVTPMPKKPEDERVTSTSSLIRISDRRPKPRAVRPVPPDVEASILSRPLGTVQMKPRMHTIVDGDTLKLLAAEYLGSEHRYQEIYDANRSLLKQGPDVLPIGETLKIPSARPTRERKPTRPERRLVPVRHGGLRGAENFEWKSAEGF